MELNDYVSYGIDKQKPELRGQVGEGSRGSCQSGTMCGMFSKHDNLIGKASGESVIEGPQCTWLSPDAVIHSLCPEGRGDRS